MSRRQRKRYATVCVVKSKRRKTGPAIQKCTLCTKGKDLYQNWTCDTKVYALYERERLVPKLNLRYTQLRKTVHALHERVRLVPNQHCEYFLFRS